MFGRTRRVARRTSRRVDERREPEPIVYGAPTAALAGMDVLGESRRTARRVTRRD
jgi:hypothetical protein